MKNYTKLFLLITIFTLALSCTGKRGVPEGFDEAIVNSVIEKTIVLVSERNYGEVVKLFAPVMSSLNLETFAQVLNPILDSLGGYEKTDSVVITAQQVKDIGDVALAIVTCKYLNKKAVYTISIDKNYQICGFYVK